MKRRETPSHNYVEQFVIGEIEDPFSAEFLWSQPGLFGGRGRLRDLLERHPRARRFGRSTVCFTHVELHLPKADVEHDRRVDRGERTHELCTALEELHRRDFGKLVPDGEEVRYRILPSEDLMPDQIRVRFGHAIHVPAKNQAANYRLSVSVDDVHWKPAGEIAADQRLTLLAGTTGQASHAMADWPLAEKCALMLINEAQASSLELVAEPEGSIVWRYDARRDCYVLHTPGAEAEAPQLLLRIERLAIVPNTGKADANEAADRNAIVTNATFIPRGPQPQIDLASVSASGTHLGGAGTFSLVALLLPRLNGYRQNGVRELVLGFDEELNLMPTTPSRKPFLSLRIDTADKLLAETEAGQRRLPLPIRFSPVAGAEIRLDEPPLVLRGRYHALLHLPRPIRAQLPRGPRLTVGRGNPMLAELRVLDDPDYLRMEPGAEPATPDRLGFSRKAFTIEVGDDGLMVTRLSSSQALLHLDESLAPVAVIEGDIAHNLPPGHHLAAGHYIFRYNA